MQIKVGEGKYERVPWANFSQEDLKKFAKVQKLEPLVEPFIEITQEEKIKKTEVNIKQPLRLERPPPQLAGRRALFVRPRASDRAAALRRQYLCRL